MRFSEHPLEAWNRRLHYYVGLYLLFFVWLFSLSGLILNHSGWRFARFWELRKQERLTKPLAPVSGVTTLERARGVMAQLGLAGELEWDEAKQQPGKLVFRAGRPGRSWDIDADLAAGAVTVNSTTLNGWGPFQILHTFTGVRAGRPDMRRDWLLTGIWGFAMDALAAGLGFLVLSGWWVWFRSRRHRLAGTLALAAGAAVCVFFLVA